MEPEIRRLGPLTLVGCAYRGKNEHGEIPGMWDRDFIPRVGELGDPRVFYGVVRMPPDCAPGEFEYVACAELAPGQSVPDGMVVCDVPAQAYAVLPANDVPDLGRAFDALHAWAAQSAEYAPAEGSYLEYYPETFPQDSTILVHAPVRARGATT